MGFSKTEGLLLFVLIVALALVYAASFFIVEEEGSELKIVEPGAPAARYDARV